MDLHYQIERRKKNWFSLQILEAVRIFVTLRQRIVSVIREFVLRQPKA